MSPPIDPASGLDAAQHQVVLGCQAVLNYEFRNPEFLLQAITHASVANTRLRSYERLEFLGDSLLGFVVSEYLFHTYPDWLEGELTRIKSKVVSRDCCAGIARELGIESFLVVGKGIEQQGGVPESLLANAFESILAAIYLDGGYAAAQIFLQPLVQRQVEAAVSGELSINYKAQLQQYAQKRFGFPPQYEVLASQGPDHDKWFQIVARVHKKTFSPAWGKNKKQAQQRAAANAIAEMQGEAIPFDQESPGGDGEN